MLNNIVNIQEQYGQQNIVQACFQQHCYRLGVFPCVCSNFSRLFSKIVGTDQILDVSCAGELQCAISLVQSLWCNHVPRAMAVRGLGLALALGKLNFSCVVIGLTFINRAFRGSGCRFSPISYLPVGGRNFRFLSPHSPPPTTQIYNKRNIVLQLLFLRVLKWKRKLHVITVRYAKWKK